MLYMKLFRKILWNFIFHFDRLDFLATTGTTQGVCKNCAKGKKSLTKSNININFLYNIRPITSL